MARTGEPSEFIGAASRQLFKSIVYTTDSRRDSQVFKMHSENEACSSGHDCKCSNPDCPCGKKSQS